MESPGSKVFIIGGRRGLGKKIAEEWKRVCPQDALQISSRTKIPAADKPAIITETFHWDMSQESGVNGLLKTLQEEQPTHIFYVAGGGPYGPFSRKAWKDHSWSLSVSLLAPMKVLHGALNLASCQQFIVIGSAIAESASDKNAASYCAAKHGLMGLISSVVLEGENKDIRLFSPGYMGTDMLPANAAEKTGKPVSDPADVARAFVQWAQTPKAAWHKIYTP